MKKPQAGEWWFANDGSGWVYIVGKAGRKTVFQLHHDGPIMTSLDWWSDWHHEPECTGWNWIKLDWVALTDPEHVLRKGIDWMQNQDGEWFVVNAMGDCKLGSRTDLYKTFRCLRKNMPVPETFPQLWTTVEPTRIPVRLWVSDRVLYEDIDTDVRCGNQIPSHPGCEWHELKADGTGGFYVEALRGDLGQVVE